MQDSEDIVRDDWRKHTIAAAARSDNQPIAPAAPQGDRIGQRAEEEPERWDGMS